MEITRQTTRNNNTNTNASTTQNNTADVNSNLNLVADPEIIPPVDNTGGNSAINTGKRQCLGKCRKPWQNDNISGNNVQYNVVNIYGNLDGDIILPSSDATGTSDCSTSCTDAYNSRQFWKWKKFNE